MKHLRSDGNELAAFDEEVEERLVGLELDVLDAKGQRLQLLPVRFREQDARRPFEGGVTHANELLLRERRKKTDAAPCLGIDVPGEASREIETLDVLEVESRRRRAAIRSPATFAPFACASSLTSHSVKTMSCAASTTKREAPSPKRP